MILLLVVAIAVPASPLAAAVARSRAICVSPFSLLPRGVLLVGSDAAGAADPLGETEFVFRDLSFTPVAGAVAVLDFSTCLGQVRLGQPQPFTPMWLDCPTHTVRVFTDVSGIARFRVVGGAGPPSGSAIHARVWVDDSPCTYLPVAALDLDGAGGLGSNDLGLWVGDFVAGRGALRGDYDFDGALGANDLALWVGALFTGGSVASVAACP